MEVLLLQLNREEGRGDFAMEGGEGGMTIDGFRFFLCFGDPRAMEEGRGAVSLAFLRRGPKENAAAAAFELKTGGLILVRPVLNPTIETEK